MSMSRRMSVGLLGIAFLVALVSAMPVEAKVPLRWEGSATFYWPGVWEGMISGEDGSLGYFTWTTTDPVFLSNVQHTSSIWRIDWVGGGFIEGTAEGTVVYTTIPHDMYAGGDFVYNGKVTDASSDWSHLVGRKVHITGHMFPWPWTADAVLQIN